MLALFSFGYVAMSRHITNAGAFYSYISQGLGRPLGVGGSLVALLAYNLLQIGLYGAFGFFASVILADKADLTVDWWILALALWLIVAVLGLLRVDVNSKVLMVLLGAELIAVTIFDFIFLSNPAEGGVSFEPWTWGSLKDEAGPAFAVVHHRVRRLRGRAGLRRGGAAQEPDRRGRHVPRPRRHGRRPTPSPLGRRGQHRRGRHRPDGAGPRRSHRPVARSSRPWPRRAAPGPPTSAWSC